VSYTRIAAISPPIPNSRITRLRLKASTCRLISVRTRERLRHCGKPTDLISLFTTIIPLFALW